MSLKAGRVGVNPADVDPIDGHISPSSIDSYTKTEADAKFETQEAAAALQPKTLTVPISMLQGSLLVPKTTVEDVIQTMDNAMTNKELTDAQSFGYKVEAINGMTGGTTAYDSQIKIPKGTYTIIANVFVATGGALVFKINDTDVVIDRNVPNSNFCAGSRAITFDGNTNLTMRCSADTNAVLDYAYLTFIKLKDFQTLT